MAHDDDFDPFIAEIARELKAPVSIDARFDQRVMAALEPAVIPISVHRDARSEARPWYRRTFSFSVTQVAGLAAAAALVGVVAMNAMSPSATSEQMVASLPDSGMAMQPVANVTRDPNALVQQQFILIAPSATSVSLVGDFSDWDATKFRMERVSEDGAWQITIPLAPGRYEYQFELDGKQRITDPTRPQASSDFGSANSVVTVEPKD
jgi:hypothetical protein